MESPEDEGLAEPAGPASTGPQIADAQMLLPRAPDDPGPLPAGEFDGGGQTRGPAY